MQRARKTAIITRNIRNTSAERTIYTTKACSITKIVGVANIEKTPKVLSVDTTKTRTIKKTKTIGLIPYFEETGH